MYACTRTKLKFGATFLSSPSLTPSAQCLLILRDLA